ASCICYSSPSVSISNCRARGATYQIPAAGYAFARVQQSALNDAVALVLSIVVYSIEELLKGVEWRQVSWQFERHWSDIYAARLLRYQGAHTRRARVSFLARLRINAAGADIICKVCIVFINCT